MELREALAQITEIRLRMARAEIFRGYRAGPAALSGVVAFAAAGLQYALVPDPARQIAAYVALWVGAAALSAATAGLAMALYYRREAAPLERQTAWLAAEQFFPSVVAGALLTFTLARFAPASLWLLPGLWQILFSQGLFASRRLMPRAIVVVAIFYLATGLLCLALARGEHAFSPWAMGLPFGVGQLLAGAVLYRTLERNDGRAA
ncbi:MAG: hypothetical protein ACYTEZ_07200 [Planctomycetota bacterium]|jgi:hypothetical protein